jgi:hypothetical protein
MTTIAVAMRTESGDDYLSMFTGVTGPKDFVARVADEMGEELAYVYYSQIVTDDGETNVYKHALQERIEEQQRLEDGFFD